MSTNQHPNLIQMDFVFHTTNFLYFAMPLIQGGDLYLLHQKYRQFSEETVLFYAVQIIDGIGCLHKNNIIHRDLKLENVLVDQEGYLTLIDFGISKKVEQGEAAETVCGSLEYMSPEQVRQGKYNRTVDWWAVGILMYELLIGISPFRIGNINMGSTEYERKV